MQPILAESAPHRRRAIAIAVALAVVAALAVGQGRRHGKHRHHHSMQRIAKSGQVYYHMSGCTR